MAKRKMPDGFHSFSATTVEGKTVDFGDLKGKIVLVQNVASL
eukprot:CAMPEP_0175089730 /NCGR_PEP_ID=MMETSP0086_2-20121207/941_1 /TAXON_ID=136419 /ORGANISM="Unknown Unknown, Strain D1" /LENGTH=41 /DNA_ID= /DNA_START= /DNA_END= /DNA_ORIENTATION=